MRFADLASLSAGENMSSEFPTGLDSYQPLQPHKQAKGLKFRLKKLKT